jgi:hypothetical protein
MPWHCIFPRLWYDEIATDRKAVSKECGDQWHNRLDRAATETAKTRMG